MYSPRFEEALAWVAQRHEGQMRKAQAVPYWTHLVHVALILARYGYSEDAQVAALLHDLVEDTAKSLTEADAVASEIEHAFGLVVRRAVEDASEAKYDDAGRKLPWRVRKETFVARLPGAGPEGLAVVAGDKLHNAGCLVRDLETHGAGVWKRFNAGPADAVWYYRAVAAILSERLPGALSGALSAQVDALALALD